MKAWTRVGLGPVKHYINHTDGGWAGNTGLQVPGRNDVPIPRLYAAQLARGK